MIDSKTPMQSAVEGAIGGLLGSFLAAAHSRTPTPPLCDEGQPITAMSICEQIERSLMLNNGPEDRERAIRQALVLAAMLARQEGWRQQDGALAVALAWTQTENLTAAPIRG